MVLTMVPLASSSLKAADMGTADTAGDAEIYVTHFEPDGGGIVVCPEGLRRGMVDPNGDTLVIEMACEAGEGEIGDEPLGLKLVGGRKGRGSGGSLVEPVVNVVCGIPA